MSDPLSGTGSQIGLTPQQLNVPPGSAVRFQHVLTTGTQNLNLLSTGGQQFVITSQVSVPGLTQVIPTLSTSNQNIQQSSVARIVNITPQQRVISRGPLQLASPGADGRVSFVAISPSPSSGQVRAAAHPTLVTSLASPIRQPQRTNSAISPSAIVLTSPTQPNHLVQTNLTRKRPKLYENLDNNFFNDEKGPAKRRILDNNSVKLNQCISKYAEYAAELFFLDADGSIVDLPTWKSKRQDTQQLCNFLKTNKLELDDEDEDLTSVLAFPDHENEGKQAATVSSSTSHSPAAAQTPQAGTETTLTNRLSSPEKRSPTKQLNKLMLNPVARQHTRQHSISAVYDTSIGSQEQIVEKAKQEAYVVQRVSELQREGLWSEKRLPKVQEPPRNKAHWDYLLEEMVWLAADFAQERKWKKANAKKCAKMVQKYFQDKAIMQKKEEKSQELKLRKLANFMAKEVKNFWANVNKLVEYKQTTRLEEKRKKALDQHLSFIVDQTEKYSSWLAESMNKSGVDNANKASSTNCSRVASPVQKSGSDDDFEPNTSSEDDEETIAKEEGDAGQTNNSDEIERLKQESELPLEDLLKDLPEDYWNQRDKNGPSEENNQEDAESNKSEDFTVDSANETSDDEETLEEQEKAEGKVDHSQELADLEAENDMDIEELRKKYGQASGELPSPAEEEDEDAEKDEDDESSSESGSGESSEEEMEQDEEEVGLRSLIDDESDKKLSDKDAEGSNEKANKEINDVAAIAESLQPKGNTLLTTSVVTPIPFLLKHTLREYQHIGLDWLVTMFDRKLNGILADEMGLGKTIQTIALLAHLACEKGNWGPHLIIVPTSVMLNWEMEFKKWCPAFKILTYYGTQKERKHKRAGWTKPNAFHVCITSYKLVIQDHQSFRRKKWKYLILDEAQNIKNFKSQRWQLLLNFQTQRRLLLTGTPLQNNLMELWSLMHFLMPNVFQSHREFKEWFSNPVTGMIEGNSEYNENIIKRLHKVLRPFLLRRLKTEVEKQLPKKYEHVVMCRLSKRQRYLYDDFMSRAKTKETLASGNLLSVINVLMQLRKVCNHPNLFEVRPILSPFQMEGIVYYTASLVAKALEYDPYKHVDLNFLNVVFVNLEKMTAYVCYRVKKMKTPRKLIEEIDSAPDDPPRCPPAKIKISIRNPEKKQPPPPPPPVVEAKNSLLNSLPPARVGTSPLIKSLTIGGTSQGVSLRISGSQVQLIPHQGGIKAVTNQDGVQRGLPVQLVQTSTGRHIYFPLQSQSGSNTVIAANGQRLTLAKASSADVKLVNSSSNSNSSITKPVNWTSNVNIQNSTQGAVVVGTTTVTTTTTIVNTKTCSAISQPVSSPVVQTLSHTSTDSSTSQSGMVRRSDVKNEQIAKKKLDIEDKELKAFYIPKIEERLKTRRKEKLNLIATLNECRCEAYPLYGSDLIESVRIVDHADALTDNWLCSGLIHCRNVHRDRLYWSQTHYLNSAVKKPQILIEELQDVLKRFVFFVPSVAAPRIQFHCSHPSSSTYWGGKRDEMAMRADLSPRCDLLHPIASSMCTQFPDPRLIQYDCGKLQVLDKLLRKLKMNHHKVLLFTQMTRMLDILEAFLNYHGHIYLRLDGTTKVDQRQVLMERFNGDKRIFCFILSTRSGGIGVNLTGADTVIFYDSDWNPTMDAQAQDRCHRIGQTRDVHIYRLVSEMTVEENILKKANQKRLLGDLAIEGGNFTTAYFKSSTIQDLFNVDVSETDASRRMAEVLNADKEKATAAEEGEESSEPVVHPEDKAALGVLESALAAAEDESDVQAARTAKAEAAAELAEFDENIPFDEATESAHVETELSKAEQEVNSLVEQLTPIERYAMRFVEENEAAWSAEQLAAAEAQIEQQKREWELGRLQALKAEEERRLQEEELDEDLLTYSREDATNQVWLCRKTNEEMPMWCPPTPPQEQNDVYLDQTMCFLYESQTMLDTQLPPVYVKKELKRVRSADASPIEGRRAVKIHRKEDSPGSAPRSLFDHPSSALQKMRRDMKMQKYRGLVRPSIQVPGQKPPAPAKPSSDSENMPEWTIHEDWALLQSIEKLQELPLNLVVLNPGHTPNWDMVADMVNMVSSIYRSPSQCRNRYESVIVPREEGKLLQDSKKQKKTKSVYKLPVTKSSRPVRTCQLYMQDNNASFTDVYHQRFDNIKVLSFKRSPTLKQVLVNPTMKNPKHADVLTESGITYEAPVNPIEIATRRAERIAKEKQKTLQAAQANAGQTLTPEQLAQQQQLIQQRQQLVAAAAATKQAAVVASTAAGVSVGIPIANAVAGNAQVIQTVTTSSATAAAAPSQSIVIASAQQISSVVPTATITTLSPGLRQTRPVATIPVGIQEMVVASQARTVPNSTATAVVSVAQIQAARIATGNLVSATSIPGSVATVKGAAVPAATVASGKGINNAQVQYLKQQAILRQQQQRLIMRDQQLKVIQGQPSQISQAGVIGQQKVTAVATVSGVTAVQPVSPSQQKAQFLKQTAGVVTKGRPEEVAALMKQQIQRQQKTAVTVTQQPALTAQILAQAGLSVQTGTPGQTPVATLVKTSTGGQSVTIPMTGIAIPQVKATINPQIKTTPGTNQQMRQLGINYQQVLTKQGRGQATKVTQIAKPGLQTQLIVQSQGGKAIPVMQHIQQVIKNVQPQHITVSTGQQVLQQGSQVVLGKSPQVNTGTVQTRVIPASGSQSSRQTIQVVPGALRAVPSVTIDASGRSQVSVSSTLASALTGSIKVAQSGTSSQQAFISQVAATLPGIVRQAGVNPVRIQTSSASGTPLMAVTVQQQQIRTSSTQNQPDNSQNQS